MARMRAELQAASVEAAQHNFFVETLLDEEKQKTASLCADLSRARQSSEEAASLLEESEAARSRLEEENRILGERIAKVTEEIKVIRAENQYMHKLRSTPPATQSPKAPSLETPKSV